MNPLVVLAAIFPMGTNVVAGATGYSWRIDYRDGVSVELGSTVDPRIDLEPRPGRAFKLTACALPGMLCSPASYEVVSQPLSGDTTPFDGLVGWDDYQSLGRYWGNRAP